MSDVINLLGFIRSAGCQVSRGRELLHVGGRRVEVQAWCREPVVTGEYGGAHARWCEEHRPRFWHEGPERLSPERARHDGWSRGSVVEPPTVTIGGLAELYKKSNAVRFPGDVNPWPKNRRKK